MSVSNVNFVALTAAAGSGAGAYGTALAVTPAVGNQLSSAGLAVVLDRFTVDLSAAGYPKNGTVVLGLAASTPQTIDLTALAGVVAGDTGFSAWKEIVFTHLSGSPVAVSPGASNPARTPLGGTTPTFTVEAGARERWHAPAGKVVDGTHKTLTFDPGGAPAVIAASIGGS